MGLVPTRRRRSVGARTCRDHGRGARLGPDQDRGGAPPPESRAPWPPRAYDPLGSYDRLAGDAFDGVGRQDDATPPGPVPEAIPPLRRRTGEFRPALPALVALGVVVLVAGVLAVVVGRVVSAPSPLSPTSGGSSAPGAPADAGALATKVDPALVDINVTDAYEDTGGAGTGMVLTGDGVVLTNNHVVEDATSISVTDVGNGRSYDATVVGYDRSDDVAVLRLVGASALRTVNLGRSSSLAKGDGVVAVGNAEGAGGTPSYAAGSVTALGVSIEAADELNGSSEQLSGLVETNVDILPGDSGGAMVDRSGRVVAMNTAGSESFQFEQSSTESYAVPIDRADADARAILLGRATSTVHVGPTAFLGVETSAPVSSGPGSQAQAGAEIEAVVPGGPAARAGLQAGDVVTAMGGEPVTSPEALTEVLLGEASNATVEIDYLDPSGVARVVEVQLESGPAQ